MTTTLKKIISIIGIAISLAILVMGFSSMNATFKNNTDTMGTTTQEHGYATFGSDYYTYSNNNMALAGYGALNAANNIADLADLTEDIAKQQQTIGAYVLIALGGMGICAVGLVFVGCLPENKDTPVAAVATAGAPIPEEFVPPMQSNLVSEAPAAEPAPTDFI